MRVPRSRGSMSGSIDDDRSAGPSTPSAYPLMRGAACLSCRKRKMKCDAVKPACNQCTKANRPHDCEYDDGKSKSRTQVMQEKILKQEARIRELEHFGTTSSIVAGVSQHLSPPNIFGDALSQSPGFFDDPTTRTHSPLYGSVSPQPPHIVPDLFTSSSDGLMSFGNPLPPPSTVSGSTDSPSLSAGAGGWSISEGFDFQMPIVDPSTQQPAQTLNAGHLHHPQPQSMPSMSALDADLSWANVLQPEPVPGWESEDIPLRTRQMLLDIFLKHTVQCGLVISVPRLLKNIHLPLGNPQRPHAALLNAMFLLAAKFSANPSLRQFESRFMGRTTEAIAVALERSDRLVNVVQAQCLLAFYLYSSGRLLEGFMHSSAAARLAIGLDLHKIVSIDPKNANSSNAAGQDPEREKQQASVANPATSSQLNILPPPVDMVELGERINAFWMAFNVDRAWAVATGMPIAFSDGEHVRTQIETVWPRAIADYENGTVTDNDYATLKDLYPTPQAGPPPKPLIPRSESTETLRAKAIALFERASRLSAGLSTTRGVNESFWVEFRNVEYAIHRFSMTLPSVRHSAQAGTNSPRPGGDAVDHGLAFVHTLTYVATIQLHHVFAYMDATSHDKCLVAAGGALAVLRDLGEADARLLDPVLGTAWMCVADTLVREQVRLKQMPGSETQAATVGMQLHTIVGAMKQLSEVFPVCGYQVSRVQEARQLA